MIVQMYMRIYPPSGPLAPPPNLDCQNTTRGLEVTWDSVVDESCAMSTVEYNVTIPDVMFAERVNSSRIEIIINGGESYNISVVAVRTVNRSFTGQPAFITCMTEVDIPTSPPSTTSKLNVHLHMYMNIHCKFATSFKFNKLHPLCVVYSTRYIYYYINTARYVNEALKCKTLCACSSITIINA